jgi:hypothetical protein
MPGWSLVRPGQGFPEVERVGGLIAVHFIVELCESSLCYYLAVARSRNAIANACHARPHAC